MQIKNQLKTGSSIPLRYHLIFWLVYFLINVVRFGSINHDYWYSFKSNLVEFPLNILITYFTIYYLIPNFIVKKKYVKFAVYFLISLFVFYLVRTGLNYILVTKHLWPEVEGNHNLFEFSHVFEVTIGVIYVIALVSAIKLTVDYILERRKNEMLNQLQLQSELKFLKSQIQPHFFFNTLNNLYALTMEKSDKAPDVVLKLSEIMQYVLYEAKEKKISLLKEINYLHSYLDLEKLRYGDNIQSEISINGNIDTVEVPPLLFIPFVENCFKHGIKEDDRFLVTISFDLKDDFLYFTVENSIHKDTQPKTKHGIGIQNVRRRLKLLFGEEYELKTKITDDHRFVVFLKIPVL